jgi:hypothetical protein
MGLLYCTYAVRITVMSVYDVHYECVSVGAEGLCFVVAEFVGCAIARARGIFGTAESEAYPAGEEE